MDNPPNTMYPGRPDYVGPDHGLAYWVHHEMPIEYCFSFTERIAYIREHKPAHEHAVRLAALTCLPADRLPPNLVLAWDAYSKAWDAYSTAWDAYDKAVDAYSKAWDAYSKAGDAYDKAGDAYDKAVDAYSKAVDAYSKAWDAYSKAGDACNKAMDACKPLLLALMAEYVPTHLWCDRSLIFPEPEIQGRARP